MSTDHIHKETSNKPKQVNFNTVVNLIVLGVVVWVGTSINDLRGKQGTMSEDIAVMKATKPMQVEQLNRIEGEQNRMRAQVNDIQMEMKQLKPRL